MSLLEFHGPNENIEMNTQNNEEQLLPDSIDQTTSTTSQDNSARTAWSRSRSRSVTNSGGKKRKNTSPAKEAKKANTGASLFSYGISGRPTGNPERNRKGSGEDDPNNPNKEATSMIDDDYYKNVLKNLTKNYVENTAVLKI